MIILDNKSADVTVDIAEQFADRMICFCVVKCEEHVSAAELRESGTAQDRTRVSTCMRAMTILAPDFIHPRGSTLHNPEASRQCRTDLMSTNEHVPNSYPT
ncbi:hypothetical protein GOB46_23060 [Sinorhizobium meliloti]|uniref:hypothetical protein n=1 Tax=Rhizobium meliloti TaxID=382 RepID=UPI001295D9D5|nr:hypothetical protein [Sinorhizobium meliloti]MDW9415070.1 hypothetical protein [Sinorhizobium meliloti]MDW9479944.1 hypothetical protein [Sinorhizobium meliloti]MDW9510069.1 hypothetical protein [Sinorhizobium meliloti]MDW9634648.1 hypothetical protein [Sinorhizobium meliloti]MDW9668018.1 hypothetical protein [Sinorhizobium meliloti]